MTFRYSLSELFYWLTMWMVLVSVLGTVISPLAAVLVVTVWLYGTVLVSKSFGRLAGLAYSVLVGFVLMVAFMWPAVITVPRRRPAMELHFTLSLLSGLISGASVWCIASVADEAFKSFLRRRTR
jgi:hypothetical protein